MFLPFLSLPISNACKNPPELKHLDPAKGPEELKKHRELYTVLVLVEIADLKHMLDLNPIGTILTLTHCVDLVNTVREKLRCIARSAMEANNALKLQTLIRKTLGWESMHIQRIKSTTSTSTQLTGQEEDIYNNFVTAVREDMDVILEGLKS